MVSGMAINIPTHNEINDMTDQQYKVYENRLRRTAARQGLRLEKSRSRDPRAIGHGTYHLADANNVVVEGDPNTGYGLDLDTVAAILLGDRA
jgi:hypothetical protein